MEGWGVDKHCTFTTFNCVSCYYTTTYRDLSAADQIAVHLELPCPRCGSALSLLRQTDANDD